MPLSMGKPGGGGGGTGGGTICALTENMQVTNSKTVNATVFFILLQLLSRKSTTIF